MPLTLYHFGLSPPSRCALLTIRALNLDVNIQVTNLMNKDQLAPDFVAKNPQHCVPTIDDNGFILWESRAIAKYLASTYDKDEKLYPRGDHQLTATIDRLLYFDAGTVFTSFRMIAFPVLFLGETKIATEKRDAVNKALNLMNTFLEGNEWVAGTPHYTIADISLLATLSGIIIFGWDMKPYPNIQKWYERCSTIPGYEENSEGATKFANVIKSKLEPGQI